jgi:hypothetical protein
LSSGSENPGTAGGSYNFVFDITSGKLRTAPSTNSNIATRILSATVSGPAGMRMTSSWSEPPTTTDTDDGSTGDAPTCN